MSDHSEERFRALEQRITELEDERAIRDLLSRYGYYADAALDDEYFALFTDDCVMDVSSGYDPDPYEIVRWEGLSEMKRFLAERTAKHGDGFVGKSMHVQGNNMTIAVHGDEATASGYSFIVQLAGKGAELQTASLNAWKFRKVDGQWRIQQRTRRMLGAPDTADVLRVTETSVEPASQGSTADSN